MTKERLPAAFMPSERFHGITASPDGTRLAYFLEEGDAITLYTEDIAGDRSRIRTDGGWFPTDTIIWGGSEQLFTTRRELGSPSTDIHVVSLDGDLRPVITREERCLPIDASPDGRWVLFGTQQDGTWNLHLHDVSHDQTERLADVSGHHYHRQAGFSPDGRYLAFHAPVPEDDTNRVRSYLREVGEGGEQLIATGVSSGDVECRSWDEQGDRLVLASNDSDGTRDGVFDLDTGDVDWFESDASLDVMLSDGRFLGTAGGEMTRSVVVVDGSGSIRRTVLDDGICELPGLVERPTLDDGEVLLTYEAPTRPPTAARYRPATDTLKTILEESSKISTPGNSSIRNGSRTARRTAPKSTASCSIRANDRHRPSSTYSEGRQIQSDGSFRPGSSISSRRDTRYYSRTIEGRQDAMTRSKTPSRAMLVASRWPTSQPVAGGWLLATGSTPIASPCSASPGAGTTPTCNWSGTRIPGPPARG